MTVLQKYEVMGHEPHQFHKIYRIKADTEYTYVPSSERTRLRSRRWCAFATAVMQPVLKYLVGFEIHGRKNLAKLQEGAISVCNHVHPLDCVAIEIAFWKRDTYFLSQRENFGIPVVRHLIKILKALPVPESREAYAEMFRQIEPELHDGAIFQIYPEGCLRTDCMILREFKPGAFRMADMFGVPILPCAIRIEHAALRTKRILTIGEPIYSDKSLPEQLRIEKFEEDVRTAMQRLL